ncbi:MAG: glycine dehydrogenase (aminomethyl-transferring) [Candidatus Wallbacteria bacterium HGW-Wallbacteria-1]|jgi:glycine dehydrogenase subunit 2|uniref:glycine dehydrogenase (aminomethyl-transferring) n=1 Tax=Candidatus Wallbacteria bacterium HGW-Wallbacteria-1 TaxID=2013854 RepID=A0A2N1PSP4_9BACT|nr:MAG: glycine dehydrogenase (aminomethyl-transferring) [Candidatus Wallbacteria bacterium HGW-Wallbacteria-1]
MKKFFDQRLIFDKSKEGLTNDYLPVPEMALEDTHIPKSMRRIERPSLPQVSENQVMRHYTNLSRLNYGVDNGFYPLGSCTMKYNPKVNEWAASLPGFAGAHPMSDPEHVQGCLELMHELADSLAEIVGMSRVTLQPVAGASGELTGVLIMKKYHEEKKTGARKIIIPDSAHGTNPATVTMGGFEVVQVPSNEQGGIDLESLANVIAQGSIAGLMVTNPNTLGLFDPNIGRIAEMVHQAGGLVYYDGANENAIMGQTKPGTMGFDIVHLNLHKTFSTPHGGGGPGGGAVGVSKHLVKYLPKPLVEKGDHGYFLDWNMPSSIGKVHSFWGNFTILVRAYVYIRRLGAQGLKRVSETAVLNANYMLARLSEAFTAPYGNRCMHEFVLTGKPFAEKGIHTMDFAKALIDRGFHPPTIYFPLIVEEAMMIEPTETESKATMDSFVDTLLDLARLSSENPEVLHRAPETTPVTRLDETAAARKPDICYSGCGFGSSGE